MLSHTNSASQFAAIVASAMSLTVTLIVFSFVPNIHDHSQQDTDASTQLSDSERLNQSHLTNEPILLSQDEIGYILEPRYPYWVVVAKISSPYVFSEETPFKFPKETQLIIDTFQANDITSISVSSDSISHNISVPRPNAEQARQLVRDRFSSAQIVE